MITKVWVAVAALMLSSCIHKQLTENTLTTASTVEELRVRQLLDNISDAIDVPDRIPSLVVVNTGQAQTSLSGTIGTVLPSMNFASRSRTLNVSGTGGWIDFWTLSPVADPQDLQNLRALYRLLYTTDTEIAQIVSDTQRLYNYITECGVTNNPSTIKNPENAMNAYFAALKAFPTDPPDNCYKDEEASSGVIASLAKYYGLQYPKPHAVFAALRNGLSAKCRRYQLQHNSNHNLFSRWLYWKNPAGEWRPEDPKESVKSMVSLGLGTFGDNSREFWLAETASACLSDFIILAINATANSHAAALASPKGAATSSAQ